MGRPSLREKIITSGVRTVHEIGFSRAGVREITAAAGVPQGSFTNHFKSKEVFGLAILDRYLEGVEATMASTLDDQALAPADRLRAYFRTVSGRLEEADWRHGCLIGNLSLDTAEHSDLLRARLAEGMASIVRRFAATIRDAQQAGQMRGDLPAEDAAAALMAAWQGAMLWMKVHRSGESIERFRTITLATYLADG